ncbi:hypothetical protein KIN20_002102 [Parelaphostrongylus tenuis]|uniref:Uncharacterized protein n=1 Tax=Parelaphostrongylus tenuis TaxID=148309 RepID=A0AAD5LV64_PARTN|nr:hypothetical protein KIN20_002102 [Parelaphostrongylus tenuis]
MPNKRSPPNGISQAREEWRIFNREPMHENASAENHFQPSKRAKASRKSRSNNACVQEAYTDLGKQEGNNPFLYVITPKHLRNTMVYNQLRRNSEELVTHHDLHSTFKDILYYQPASFFSNVTFMEFDSNLRGSSLLRRFEDGKPRTCKTLPISFNYCICQYKREIMSDSKRTEELAHFAAQRLASVLESHQVTAMCEKIVMGKVIRVKKFVTSNESTSFSHTVKDYDVIFEVAPPAKGQFQIPIRTEHDKMKISEERFIRLDKYGSSGDCMTNDILRPLCTCKNSSTPSL